MTTVKVIVVVAIAASVLSAAFAVASQSLSVYSPLPKIVNLKKILLGDIQRVMDYMKLAEMF